MATAKTSEAASRIEGSSNINDGEAICTLMTTPALQPTTSARSPGSCNSIGGEHATSKQGPKDGVSSETCPVTPSEGTILPAPGTCAQASAGQVADQGGCTVTPTPAISPAAMMTPNPERAYSHVSYHLVLCVQ
jgi:hypothetical protein